jgi:hypothetical protein
MLYPDDNIHEALEKIAGLPGYMKKRIGKEGLKRLRTGESPIYVGGAAEKLRTTGAAHDARLRAYTRGRETAKSIAKARKSSGQERRVHLGDAAETRGMGEFHKRQFRKLVPKDIVRREKFKVASDDNIHDAFEKIARITGLSRQMTKFITRPARQARQLAAFNRREAARRAQYRPALQQGIARGGAKAAVPKRALSKAPAWKGSPPPAIAPGHKARAVFGKNPGAVAAKVKPYRQMGLTRPPKAIG